MMKKFRWLALVAAVMFVMPTLAPTDADARAGGGTAGSGSRGSKTNQAPPPTQTAPNQAAPIERSTTPATKPVQTAQAPAAAATGGSFFSRHPFLSGMMGGMLGAGLFGMMFGGGFGGAAGMFGLVFQLLLIGGLAYLAVRLFRGRSAAPATAAPSAYAYASPATDAPIARSSLPLTGPSSSGGGAGPAAQLAIAAEDFTAFEGLLGSIQTAYSAGDLGKLRSMVTPEMLGYFSEQLSANASRGLENRVEQVKLEQGDLSEAWSEGGVDYATVAMRFSMIDTMRRLSDGTVAEGNAQVRTEATEVWTFLRSRGGNWILSAIQQA